MQKPRASYALAIALVTVTQVTSWISSSQGGAVVSVGTIASARPVWVAGVGGSNLQTETLEGLTNFSYVPPIANVASTSTPYLPTGSSGTFNNNPDLGLLNYNYFMYTGSSAVTLALGPTAELAPAGKALKFSATSAKWGWLQFIPDAPVKNFGVDFYTTYDNDYSGVGYFSYRIYYSGGTYESGRIYPSSAAVPSTLAANGYTPELCVPYTAGTGFIGFSESTARIEKVEFFSKTANSNVQIDNITFDAVSVPEPHFVGGLSVVGAVGLAFRFRKRVVA